MLKQQNQKMDYQALKKAHKVFIKSEPRCFFYDGYMNSRCDFWFRNGNVNEYEIKKLRYFIRSWDPHFTGIINKLKSRLKKIHPVIMRLKNKRIDSIDLSNRETEKSIKEIFDLIAGCCKSGKNRFESTDASKILHTILPELFVMWDRNIRNGIWKEKRKDEWKRPKKFNGKAYACFLSLMQTKAKKVIESCTNKKRYSPSQVIKEISSKANNYTLAKLLDEYNYVKYTLPKKKDP